ncbi:MAG: SHOCT domain-containing protein [Actinomycetota bacterium]
MTFWELFFILLIWIPLVTLWVFTLIDLFRRTDISGAAKALWAIAIIFLPLIGMLVYFIVFDSAGEPLTPAAVQEAEPEAGSGAADVADQLERLADLRDRGILTDGEFQREKDKLLGVEPQ